ncbi:hypothetical protein C2G38_2137386 [Gigaspora rosea]|uniref:Uncharacterized protein n=1 Tax=Gigaspora rosea TaxID=44941 RepID=A0A397W9U2_9GLOM|nr:hypothetical protein C2G38_2137386 [Gigaspora rosea]
MVNLWDDIKFKLLGVLIGIIVLSLIVLWARYKYLEGQNFMIFSAVIILFDLVMDILFIAENGKDVSQPDLYIISSYNFNILFVSKFKVLYFRYTVEYKAIPFLTLLNKSDNEDKHLYDNYTNDNIQLENGENDNEENNNRESSTFIHNEDQHKQGINDIKRI